MSDCTPKVMSKLHLIELAPSIQVVEEAVYVLKKTFFIIINF